jgi:hypothetical protein
MAANCALTQLLSASSGSYSYADDGEAPSLWTGVFVPLKQNRAHFGAPRLWPHASLHLQLRLASKGPSEQESL